MGKNLKVILSVIGLILIVGGTAGAIILVRQRQEIRKEAATPSGTATITLSPSTGNLTINQTFPVEIKFNTKGKTISALSASLSYQFQEDTPPVEYSQEIQMAPPFTNDNCPIHEVKIDNQNKRLKINIACVILSPQGYSNNSDTLLASFNLIARHVPQTNPIVLEFDPAQTIITDKETAQDILLSPTGQGVYTVNGNENNAVCDLTFTVNPSQTPTPATPTATSTPVPTSSPTSPPVPTATSTPWPTPTNTIAPIPSPTPTTVSWLPTATPTPTYVAQLPTKPPVTGFTLPTFGAIIGGVTVLIGSLLLLF